MKIFKAKELGELFFYALYKCKSRWIVDELTEKTIRKIQNDLKINLKNYKIEIHSDYLIHFLNSHFSETRKNQRSIRFSDIEKIGNVVNHYTTVILGNKDNTLLFKKNNPDGIFEFVVFVDDKKKILSGRSFRIKTYTDL